MLDNQQASFEPEPDGNQESDTPYIEYGSAGIQNAPRPPALPTPPPAIPVQPVVPAAPAQSLPIVNRPAPQQRRYSAVTIILLALVIALVVIGGSGLAYFALAVHPREMQAGVTAVAGTVLASQARSTATSQAQATATITAMSPQQIYAWATSGTPVLNDPLTSQQGGDWYQGGTATFGCMFTGGAYHVMAGSDRQVNCPSFGTYFHNLAFQAQMTIITGSGGLSFDTSATSVYIFEVSQGGGYALVTINSSSEFALTSGNSAAFNTGPNQPNLLTAIDIDGQIYLYINRQPVAHVFNNTYTSGQINLYATGSTTTANIAYNNLQVWSL